MIEPKEVEYIARLARIKLSENEIELFTKELSAILEHAAQLNLIATEGVEPTCFVSPQHDPLRDDMLEFSLPKEELLRNGPKITNGFFSIPKVIVQ